MAIVGSNCYPFENYNVDYFHMKNDSPILENVFFKKKLKAC